MATASQNLTLPASSKLASLYIACFLTKGIQRMRADGDKAVMYLAGFLTEFNIDMTVEDAVDEFVTLIMAGEFGL